MTATCEYVTSLDRKCGRPATQPGEHCDFHSVLAQLEAIDHRQDEMVITVPASQRPMVDRILSDVLANFDAMPYRSMDDFRPLTSDEIAEQTRLTREVLGL